MAAKKIGAIIALDGEREFKQNVTSCNKALSSLKSELGLVEAQYEGQQNSLEALTKKHSVLSRMLEEQRAKQEETVKGLEHARGEYEKVEKGIETLNKEQESHKKRLEELQQEYQDAANRMEKMTEAGNASEQSMKKQQSVVDALSRELQEEKETLKEVETAIKKGNQNYQTASNRVKDWETKLNTAERQVIKATAAVKNNAKYLDEAERSTDKCAKSIDEYGKQVKEAEKVTVDFGTAVKANIANTVTDAFKDGAVNAAKSTMDIESAQKQLQASTGATATEMNRYKQVMEELHSNNYGNDINDVAKSMALVKQYTGEVDPSKLKELTENGIAMRDVFDMDLSETIRGVDVLIGEMGLDAEEAFDLMAKGAQNGLDKSGELADNLAEYGSLYQQAGFSAKEMFAIMQNGLDSGAYSLDKVNDFVKEFSISLADGRIEESLDQFSSKTQTLFKQWKVGKATSKDVFKSVINDLATATNKQEMLTLASNTWSALGEDNAMDIITSLNEVNHTYDDVKGTMEEIKEIKYDTLEARFQQLGKKFQTEVGVPIAEKALPAIETGLDLVIDNMDLLISVMGGVAAGAVAFKTVSVATTVLQTATEGATVAQTIFNAVCNANPIVLVTTAIVAGTTALVAYASSAGEASEESKRLAEMNQKVCDSAKEVSEATGNLIGDYKENNAQLQAQGEYTRVLAGRIQKLAGKEKLSNEEKEVMQGYITELNELIPDLNLAYDEQAGKLNRTNEQMEEYLNHCQKEIEVQAAQEYALELIKKRSELEIEAIKLGNEAKTVEEERNAILEEENDILMNYTISLPAWLAGKADEKKSYDELTEAQKLNKEALEENKEKNEEVAAEIEATREHLKELGVDWDTATASTDANTEATNTNAEAQQASAESNAIAAQTIADTYTSMQQKVSEVLESQMNMFEAFNAGTEISSQQLLQNMQSQIDGVSNWADNMAILADRGVNQGIIEKLAEMGPQGSTYVQAFASMTDEQLKQANEMWTKSLDMKAGVDASVQGMIEQYTVALNGGKDRISSIMTEYGTNTVQGLVAGISANGNEVQEATKKVADAAGDGYKNEMEINSPSKKMKRYGKYTIEGITTGIEDNKKEPVKAVKKVADEIEDTAKKELGKKKFNSIGKNVPEGLADGIKSGSSTVEKAMASITKKVKTTNLNTKTLYNEGKNVSAGLAKGIRAGESEVINAVSRVCASAVSEARRKLDIHSPSKVFETLGGYTAEGFGVGYQKKMQYVNAMIRESMEIPSPGRNAGWTENGGENKVIVELPIYVGKTYSKTEIVEIAMNGIAAKQSGRLYARGVSLNGI